MTYRRPPGSQSRRTTVVEKTVQSSDNLSIHLSVPDLEGQVGVQKKRAFKSEPFPSLTETQPTQSITKRDSQNDHHLQHEVILGTITSTDLRKGPFKFKLAISRPRPQQRRLQQAIDELLIRVSLNDSDIVSVEDEPNPSAMVDTYRHKHNLRSNINSRERSLAPPLSSTLANLSVGSDNSPRKRQFEPDCANETSLATRDTRRKKRPDKWLLDGVLYCDNDDDIKAFFHARFRVILQNPCKQVQQFIIQAIITRKSSIYPYAPTDQGGIEDGTEDGTEDGIEDVPVRTPDFWPEGLKWQGPDRMDTRGRLTVLTRIFMLPLLDKPECNAILFGHKYCSHRDLKEEGTCTHKWASWKQLLENVLLHQKGEDGEMALNLREKHSASANAQDHESNNTRHLARLEILEELIDIAGQLEVCAEGLRDRKSSTVNFTAIPDNTRLTSHRHICRRSSVHKASKSSNNTAATDQRHQTRDDPTRDVEDSGTEMDIDGDQDFTRHGRMLPNQTAMSMANVSQVPQKPTDYGYSTCPPSATTVFGSSNVTMQGLSDVGLRSAGENDSTYTDIAQLEDHAGIHDRGRPDVGCALSHGSSHPAATIQTSMVVPQVKTIARPAAGIHADQQNERRARFARGRSPSRSGYRSKSAGPQPSGIPSAFCVDRYFGDAPGIAEYDGHQRPSMRYLREDAVRDFNYNRSYWNDPISGSVHQLGEATPVRILDAVPTTTNDMFLGSTLPHGHKQEHMQDMQRVEQQQQVEKQQVGTCSGSGLLSSYHDYGHMVVDAAMTTDTQMFPGYDDWMHASGFQSFAPEQEMQDPVAASAECNMIQQETIPCAQLGCGQMQQGPPQHELAPLYTVPPNHLYASSQQAGNEQQQEYERKQQLQQFQQQHHQQQYQPNVVRYGHWQYPQPYANPANDYPPQPCGFYGSAV